MSLHTINKSIHKTYDWLYDIADNCGWDDLNKSLASLRAVLHQLRDNLPLNELVHFSAQLPLFIKGIYFENWNPNIAPLKERTRESFLASIEESLKRHPEIDLEEAIMGVFSTLFRKLPEDEMIKLSNVLPKGVRSFLEEAYNNIYNIE
jgi:uncharacterized protein (DUF2267 family)